MNSNGSAPGSSLPAVPTNVIPFANLRLSQPLAARVLMEYEDQHGRSFQEVSLTCSAQTPGGRIYFGGYAAGKFRIFRAEKIHQVIVF